MCVCGGGHPSPPPEGVSNPQPVLRHAGVVSAQNWLTGERLRGGDANVLPEKLEPLWFTALLLRVPGAGGLWMLYQSALGQVSMQADRWSVPTSGARGRVRVSVTRCLNLVVT
jgi:hypothetical protein